MGSSPIHTADKCPGDVSGALAVWDFHLVKHSGKEDAESFEVAQTLILNNLSKDWPLIFPSLAVLPILGTANPAFSACGGTNPAIFEGLVPLGTFQLRFVVPGNGGTQVRTNNRRNQVLVAFLRLQTGSVDSQFGENESNRVLQAAQQGISA